MARRWSLIVALLALALALLAGLGAFDGLGVPAWLVGSSPDEASLDADAAHGAGGAAPAGGPRLEGQTAGRPDGEGGAGGVARTTGPRITGRCVDAAGKAVAGARVIAIPDSAARTFRLDDLAGGDAPATTTRADDAGRFSIEVRKESPYHVVLADASGFALSGKGAVPVGTDVTLTLRPAGVLEGRVLTREGAPIAGARVRALLLTDCIEHGSETLSQADGRYRLEGWPVRSESLLSRYDGYMHEVGLEATAEGFAPLRVAGERFGAAFPERLDLTLARGARLRGRVEDAESGAPIAGAEVAVHSIEGMRGYSRGPGLASYSSPYAPRVLARATSGADGTFLVEHLPCDGPHGTSSNNVLPSGKRALGGVSAWAPGYAAEAQNLEVAEDGKDLERVLRLRPSGVVTGRVLEASGEPVAKVYVSVQVEGVRREAWVPPVVGQPPASWASTGADGRFSIPAAPAGRGEPLRLLLQATDAARRARDGQQRQATRPLELKVGASVDVGDIVLPEPQPPFLTTTVLVVDGAGSPVFGAGVGQGGWGSGMRTDAEGRVQVPWPAPREGREQGPIHLQASAPGYAPTPFSLPPPPQHTSEVRVVLAPGHRLAGRVLKPDGSPATGVQVLIGNGAADPRLAFPDDLGAAYSQVGQPTRDGGRPLLYQVVHADEQGAFEARDLPAGPYHVRSFGQRRVAPPPGTPALAVTLSAVAADTLDLVVRLPPDDSPPTGGLLVRVLDAATREPVLDAMVFARLDGRVVGTAGSRGVPGGPPPPPPSSRPPGVEPSGPGAEPGTYRLTNLPVGRVTLEVLAPGRRNERLADVEVVADRISPTPDVRLGRGACVTGRIVPPQGEKLEGHQVQLIEEGAPFDAPPASAPVAADGSFSVCGLGPARYAVRCLPQGFNPQARVWIPAQPEPLVVTPGALELTLEGAWLVAGIVALQPDDARLPPAPWDGEAGTVERTRFGAATRVTLTDAQGRTLVDAQPVYRRWLGNVGFQYLPPGRYVARIQFPDGEAREESVNLEAGAQVNVAFRKKP